MSPRGTRPRRPAARAPGASESPGAPESPVARETPVVAPTRDVRWVRLVTHHLAPWLRRYHPGEVRGLDNLPAGPALLVGNHNGGMLTPDSWLLGAALYQRFGIDGVPFALAHAFPLSWPAVGPLLRRLGAVPADHANAAAMFARDAKVLVYPGGDEDAYRPWRHRNRVVFGGRVGYVRLALRTGVPIVPVVAAGAHKVSVIIDDLRPVARALGLDRRFRVKVWPVTFSLPWGLTPGPALPLVPFPVAINIALLPPVTFDRQGAEAADDRDYVRACADHVEGLMQAALDRMTSEPRVA